MLQSAADCISLRYETIPGISRCLDGPLRVRRTLTHNASPEQVLMAHLPGDVDGNLTSEVEDLTALLGALDGSSPLPLQSVDMDRSDAISAADLLREIDLLLGAETYDTHLGTSLPTP